MNAINTRIADASEVKLVSEKLKCKQRKRKIFITRTMNNNDPFDSTINRSDFSAKNYAFITLTTLVVPVLKNLTRNLHIILCIFCISVNFAREICNPFRGGKSQRGCLAEK